MTLELLATRHDWKPNDRKHQAPMVDGLDGDVTVRDAQSGQIVAIQAMLDGETSELRRRLRRMIQAVRWDDGAVSGTSQARLNGMRYMSRVFGFTEPKPLRKRYGCSASLLYRDHPELAGLLDALAQRFWDVFTERWPEAATQHEHIVRGLVHPDWLVGGVPWTSGIINNTAALPYHRDSGNLDGTLSAMLSLRNRVKGGGLHIPEYDVTLAVPNGSLIIFDGNTVWHGVTPFVFQRKDAYRYTLVWYAKAGFREAGAAADEAARAADEATERLSRASA